MARRLFFAVVAFVLDTKVTGDASPVTSLESAGGSTPAPASTRRARRRLWASRTTRRP